MTDDRDARHARLLAQVPEEGFLNHEAELTTIPEEYR